MTQKAPTTNTQLLAMTSAQAEHQRFIVSGELLWYSDIAGILRTHLGEEAANVASAALADEQFRSLAQTSLLLANLLPLLGRDLKHSSDKARRLLGWRPRPATQTIADSARYLISHASEPRSG